MTKQKRKNIYQHEIDLKELNISNDSPEKFAEKLARIPYRGYKVETLSDGRFIIIAKPGGKRVYGQPKKEDFIVFVYNDREKSLWSISHKQILYDLEEKLKSDSKLSHQVIECLEKVFIGGEPDIAMGDVDFSSLPGEPVELILKSYKWIWGQEDANYPNNKGRLMSMEGIRELDNKFSDTD